MTSDHFDLQLLCFYFQYLDPKPGNFVSIEDGTVMGTHKGVFVNIFKKKIKVCHYCTPD